MLNKTPKANRLHIGIFGKRNAGKSSLLNALVNQEVAIVSEIAGTTTDPVEKTMEFLPLGPVVFIDTAGVDDEVFGRVTIFVGRLLKTFGYFLDTIIENIGKTQQYGRCDVADL